MGITLEDVFEHGTRWFDTVMSGGSAEAQAAFFLDPHARIHVTERGVAIGLEDHHRLHAQWINEIHSFGTFVLRILSTTPSRVRATGTVYWQAEYRERPAPNVIKAVVGEDWILERVPDGTLKFVLYMSEFHHPLPDSAPIDL
ncbi:MAG: hypothetical protein JWL84_3532 [Rhodospirillales bacterium]|nr:hypothetical protein [Rhodospirillales bacterium]